jgi:dynein heavy chain
LNDKLIKRVKEIKVEQIRAIPVAKIQKLKLFASNPLFEKERVFNASKAAGNLSLWVRAVLETYEALMIIEPKKAYLA